MTLKDLRMLAGALVTDGAFNGLARLGRLHPRARRATQGVDVQRNIPYLATGRSEHLLDVYRPARPRVPGPLPVVLYVHGGAFRMLSKETHWMMGIAWARRGFCVFNINYRLAPRHPFPAAIEDACRALVWVSRNAHRHGGDADRLILAGESAGANLVCSLAVAASFRRPEPWARAVFDAGVRPAAALPACGLLQVSDPERFHRRRKLPTYLRDRIEEVANAYLAGVRGGTDLADPLLVLERDDVPDRPLPPFFAVCGTRDPILDDTRRLKAALDRRGVRCDIRIYPGEVHAFHAMVWRPNAIDSWRQAFAFVNAELQALVV